jgi:hypothetical protein
MHVLAATLLFLGGPALAQLDQSVQQRPGVEVREPGTGRAMSAEEVERLIGTKAVTATGRDTGDIENLLVDEQGRIRAVVLEWGGVLGLGERHAVVPLSEARLEGGRLIVDATREQLEALPPYDPDVPAIAGIDPDLKPVR